MKINICENSFNSYEEIDAYEKKLNAKGKFGATASFIGSMRNFNEDKIIESMFLEHYPDMTESFLNQIANDAQKRFNLIDILILHRVGQIEISEHIALVAVWSEHRKEAFESCRFIMEELKSRAPFWKKEKTTTGTHWVKNNTPGT